MPKNDDVNKLVRFWTLQSASWIRSDEEKVQCWRSWFDRHFALILVKRLSRKHDVKTLHYHGSKTVVSTKRFEALSLSKDKWKRNEEHFGPVSNKIIQQVVQQQFNTLADALDNGYASWSCWTIVGCRSEMLFLSLSFCPLTEPVLRILLYHCRMAHDDGGFWCHVFWKVFLQESEKDGDWTMNVSIEPFTRLIWLMTLIVEFKILPTFLHHRFWAWYVSSCHGHNL